DVIKAIVATNGQSSDKGVARSSIKRLSRIVVGNNARNHILGTTGGLGASPSDPGPLFLTAANAGQNTNTAAPASVAPDTAEEALPANETHYEISMSGRSSGKTYDTVMMTVLVDI